MSNEFDEMLEPAAANIRADDAAPRAAVPNPRLVARLFAAAGNPLRVRLLRSLMRPLGTLGAAGVAAGAFVAFADRRGAEESIDADAVAGTTFTLSREDWFQILRAARGHEVA